VRRVARPSPRSAWLFAGGTLLAASSGCSSGAGITGPAQPQCETDADCFFAFQTCVSGRCSCDSSKCNGVCVAGVECRPTSCSSDGNRCGTAGFDLCDPVADECYPLNGACSDTVSCPTLGGAALGLGALTCGADSFCHLGPVPDRLESFESTPDLPVTSPSPGQVFGDGSTAAFAWPTTTDTVIATVTTTHPEYPSDISTPAWAAFLGSNSDGVRWSDGANPDGGDWSHPPAAPPSGPLFLVVAGYQGSNLASISKTIAFRVGSSWPGPGTPCDPSSSDPDQCWAPLVVQDCYSNHCQRVCASHVDCSGVADGRCGYPTASGIRYCGVAVDGADAGVDGAP
jgi:hypothetical protein